jgi:hypothetical protein
MKRKVLALFVLFLLGLTAVFFAASGSSPVNAQGEGNVWTSSAEPPEGFDDPANLAPPGDNPLPANQEDIMEGGGLVSWRVTGSTLKPRENDASYTVDANGSCTYVTGGDSSTVWNAPVSLPNGSLIDTLRMYYYDTSGSNTTAWFTIYDLYGGIVDEWSVSSNISGGNSFNDSSQINHTIDHSVYNYVINWRPVISGSTIQLCGFRVFYTPPLYGYGFIPAAFNK